MKAFWIRLAARLPLAETAVLIDGYRAVAERGSAPAGLLAELTELAKTNGIEVACVQARRTAHGFSLTLFGVPKPLHQRFRNVWAANWR